MQICYEIVFSGQVIDAAHRPDYIFNPSNDGWFGSSIGPHQHFQMVRMRAQETGRQIIRATNNGISAIIDEKGRVVVTAPQFQRLVLRGDVHGTTGLTPYVRFGNLPVLLLAILLLTYTWRVRRADSAD